MTYIFPRYLSAFIILLMLSACSSIGNNTKEFAQADDYSLALMPVQDIRASARKWESHYRQDPENAMAAVHYAQHLRHLNEPDAALEVMQMAIIFDDSNRQILKEYGKTLLATGSFQMALETFERARSPVDPDWDLLNQMGVALDHLNQGEQAQMLYAEALRYRPNEPRIIANQGMSYALSGGLAKGYE